MVLNEFTVGKSYCESHSLRTFGVGSRGRCGTKEDDAIRWEWELRTTKRVKE